MGRYNGPPQQDAAELAAISALSPELEQLLRSSSGNGSSNGNGNGACSSSPGLHEAGTGQNGNYGTFDEFLMTLKQSKRKAIRQVSAYDSVGASGSGFQDAVHALCVG